MPLIETISLFDLLYASGLMVLLVALSLWEKLRLEKDLVVGTLRSFIQLYIVGAILIYIFRKNVAGLILLVLFIMLAAAAKIAVDRQTHRVRNLTGMVFVSLILSSGFTLFMLSIVIIRWKPTWYNPQYLIPIAGMVIGNAMNAAALAVERLQSEVRASRNVIEAHLALGATAYQACKTFIVRSIRASMIPSINTLMAVGIVQLPGMMTGQIISNVSPVQAVRYQLVILYGIAFTVGVASMIVVHLTYKSFFTSAQQLREEIF
jgi:putative ABC transport system permease protein